MKPPITIKPIQNLSVVLLLLFFVGCSGEGVVDVANDGDDTLVIVIDEGTKSDEPTENLNPDPGVTNLRLDDQSSSGTGTLLTVTNQLITVDGQTFTSGGGMEGTARFQFFFGFVNRLRYSGSVGDSTDKGLFIYSDQPFDGGQAAGEFDGPRISFDVGGHSVRIDSRDDDGNPSAAPIRADGLTATVYAMHVPDFRWTAPSGRILTNVIGSAQDLSSILDHDNIRYEFNVEHGRASVDGYQIGTVGGLGSDPFEYFFIYGGTGHGGLFVISDRAFDGAVNAGTFVDKELDFTVDGYHVVFESDITMLAASERAAWVYHDAAYSWTAHGHNPAQPLFGVTGDLTGLLNQ